ncbi:amidohydrolase family protein [Streptomyces bacillaris]|uniref:amidohydrolase family protein n=1 Tax=Streptomyces bacillaris TaxID=68179 RepID=UPI003F4D68AB
MLVGRRTAQGVRGRAEQTAAVIGVLRGVRGRVGAGGVPARVRPGQDATCLVVRERRLLAQRRGDRRPVARGVVPVPGDLAARARHGLQRAERSAARAWRCRDLRDAGAYLALGSDWPSAHYDVRQVLATARPRRLPGAYDTEPVAPEQALTGLMALEGCTSHAAVAAGDQAVAGRIAPGFRADLTAFGVDPVEAPADELGDAPVRLTVTGGRVVHRG